MAKQKKRSDGLYKVSKTINGKRVYGYGHTMREANQKLEENILKAEEESRPASAMTVEEYVQHWMKSREGIVTEATALRNTTVINKFMPMKLSGNRTFGKMPIASVDPFTAKEAIANLNNSGIKCGTAISYRATIISIFHDACRDLVIKSNPFEATKAIKNTDTPASQTTHRALTIDETKQFLEAAKDNWYYNLFRFLLHTGCRIGEAGALKLEDIDFENHVLRITKTLTRTEAGRDIGRSAKTRAGVRSIPMTPDIEQILRDQIEQTNACLSHAKVVFVSPYGNFADPTTVSAVMRKICKACGVQKITPHAMRDTFATRAIESGMNPKTLQVILGHSDISMTMNLYAHVMEDTKATEMARISITG